MTISPQAYLDHLLAQITVTGVQDVTAADTRGRILAGPVRARHPLPLWDSSAMDGYALRSDDAARARPDDPARLEVIGEVEAGSGLDPALGPRQTVRIMTGAPLPTDADAVVRVEDVLTDPRNEAGLGVQEDRWAGARIGIPRPVPSGHDVRRAGEDLAVGDPIAEEGDLVTAALAAAIAAGGPDTVPVRRLPRVAVLTTGSELVTPGADLRRGQVPESNSVLVTGMLAELGVTASLVRTPRDDVDAFRRLLQQVAAQHDLVLTTGGVGPGSRDVVRLALEADEPGVQPAHVAMSPGRPQRGGPLRGGALALCLPGNPVAVAVSTELFVRPVVRAMQGARILHRRRVRMRAGTSWRARPGRLQVLPVRVIGPTGTGTDAGSGGRADLARVDDQVVVPAVSVGGVSHAVGRYGSSDALALVGPEDGDVREGQYVTVIPTGLQ
jgi:molybdopterin molybdotransferase